MSDSEAENTGCSYKCDICNRTFWGEYCIQKHVKIHTEHQVFTCSVCSKTFISATVLEKHIVNKHNEVDRTCIQGKHRTNNNDSVPERHMTAEEIIPSSSVKIESIDANVQSNVDESLDVHFLVDNVQEFNKFTDQTEGVSDIISVSDGVDCETYNKITVKADNDQRLSGENCTGSVSNMEIGGIYLSGAIPSGRIAGETNSIETPSKDMQDKLNRKHNRFKAGKDPYCDTCGLSFRKKTEKWIKEHYLNQHGTKKLHYCTICGFGFSFSNGLAKHLKNVHKIYGEIEKNRCDFCNKLFVDKSNLKEHMLVHFGLQQNTVTICTCKVCDRIFTNRSSLRRHRKIHLPEEERKAKMWSCMYCEKTFNQRVRRDEHVANVHTGDKQHICSVCGKSYFLCYELKRHMYVHTGECIEQLTCKICDQTFSRRYTLNRHMKSHSEENTRFICLVCHKSFSRLWTLQRHTMTHDGTEPYICSICGEKYVFKQQLTEHMLDKHTPESSHYDCHLCGRSYNTQHKLRVHLNQHNKRESEGKVVSGLQRTNNEVLYKNKSRVCEICGFVVKNFSRLAQHRKTHAGHRPHSCPVCSKRFRRLKTMQTHLRLHTGENFHSCTLCDKYYVREIDLEYHLRGKIHARKLQRKEKMLQKKLSKSKKL